MIEMSTDQRLEKIANKSLELLQARIEQGQQGLNSEILVKETGEALRALAEGIECFKCVMRRPEKLAIPNYS